MVTNAADVAISNGLANRLAANWRQAGAGTADVRQYEFPRRLHLFHDIVDPGQPYQQVGITHPALERLLADGEPPDIPAEATAAGAAPA
jgi:hypothetical protein